MTRRSLICITALLVGLVSPLASASDAINPESDGLMCLERPQLQGRHTYLRSLSIFLRGHAPSMDEYASLDGLDDVPEEHIDAMLASEAFAERVARLHRKLLWPNISNLSIVGRANRLSKEGEVWFRPERAGFYRGVSQLYDGVPCLNQEAEFDDQGDIITYEDSGGLVREGWVEITPYWAPEETIKVCAFDAQETVHASNGTLCASRAGWEELDCGCGPNLNYCYDGKANGLLTSAFAKDVDLRVARLVADNIPYTELFTGRTAFVNGPIVHFLKYLVGSWDDVRFDPVPYDVEHLPDLHYTDTDTWLPVQLPPEHAGVLTSPAFLLRFQTDRARANRFYNAFLCRPFQPPVGGLPAADDESAVEPDLQKRADCKYCHAILEPSAAHWGRWPERSAGYVNTDTFPAYREDCFLCALNNSCEDDCSRFYVTRSYTPEVNAYLGYLTPYVFRRDEHGINIETGPALLANQSIVNHSLPTCTARTAMEHALGRELLPEETEWLDTLALSFSTQGFRYRDLIKQIVQSDTFRRVR